MQPVVIPIIKISQSFNSCEQVGWDTKFSVVRCMHVFVAHSTSSDSDCSPVSVATGIIWSNPLWNISWVGVSKLERTTYNRYIRQCERFLECVQNRHWNPLMSQCCYVFQQKKGACNLIVRSSHVCKSWNLRQHMQRYCLGEKPWLRWWSVLKLSQYPQHLGRKHLAP